MTKKGVKKSKTTKQKKEGSKVNKAKIGRDAEKLNELLIENFVNLQKVLTNLSIKFDNLADQIAKLLQLFEISAKSFADKLSTTVPEIEKDKEFLEKLNRLLEQNKVIAKGLTLMEEKLRERLYSHQTPPQGRTQPNKNLRIPHEYQSSNLSEEI